MRIVIELKRDANPHVLLNKLFKHTQLQDTFGVIMLVLVDNEPRVLGLKEVLQHYLDHQQEIITREHSMISGKPKIERILSKA